MDYERDILNILKEAGTEGLCVQKIARHVFNTHNSFFGTLCFEDVYRYVKQYLYRNSKTRSSIIEKTAVRGIYRLNMEAGDRAQLMLLFEEEREEETPRKAEDTSLSLF